jgi:glycosyltransferase involved in cell wall biosynthesis
MRVLLLSQFYPPVIGGEERHVRNLAAALAARGHSVAVATQATRGRPGIEQDGAVKVHYLRGTLQRVSGLFSDRERPFAPPVPDPELVLGLRRVLAQEQPDIIHAHNWLLHSCLPLKPTVRAPLVVTLHDYSLVCARKNLLREGSPCSGPALSRCPGCAAQQYGGMKGALVAAANAFSSAFERRAVDKFLAVSGAVARLNALERTRVPFEVIPNFVPDDIDTLGEADAGRLAALPEEYILFVGDLHPQKGILLLLEAYGRLASPPPLLLIGRRFPETPIEPPPGVRILEAWPHAAVMHAWKRCLLGVAPSIWHEPCATVVLEAMAQGKPMVVTDMGGMPDLVADGENGYVVAPDAGALAAALARLLDNPVLRLQMGEASRRRSRAFMAAAIVSRIERVYGALLAGKRPSLAPLR